MKKVGTLKKNGSKNSFSYSEVEYDDFGWADAKDYLPLDFDLVEIKTKDKGVFRGWIVGREWDGFRIEKDTIATHWRRADHGCKERRRDKFLTN